MVPAGVVIASDIGSGIECATGIASMANGPTVNLLAGAIDGDRDLRRARLRLPLGLEQAGGERRHPALRLEARPQIEQRAVVILMRVGDDDALEVGQILLDEADVGQHEVDARQFRASER